MREVPLLEAMREVPLWEATMLLERDRRVMLWNLPVLRVRATAPVWPRRSTSSVA